MGPLRRVQSFVKSLLTDARDGDDRGREDRRFHRTAPGNRLTVERLEEREAPSSIWDIGKELTGNPWKAAWSPDWTATLSADQSGNQSDRTAGVSAQTNAGQKPIIQPIVPPPVINASVEPQYAPASAGPSGAEHDLANLTASVSADAARIRPPIQPLSTLIITIRIPLNGANVAGGGTFSTFGWASLSGATMSAWVTAGGNTYNGIKVNPIPFVPAFQWGFRFQGVPTGSPVQVTVQGVLGGNVGSDTITVTPI